MRREGKGGAEARESCPAERMHTRPTGLLARGINSAPGTVGEGEGGEGLRVGGMIAMLAYVLEWLWREKRKNICVEDAEE